MKLSTDERILWLRYVLNPSLPRPDIKIWSRLFQFAQRQAILGVCDPCRFEDIRVDKEVLYEWIGAVTMINNRNASLNEQTEALSVKLQRDGYRCCILKGQGNATMYPDSSIRTPGDIDVWVDTERKELSEYVKAQYPEEREV